MPPSPAPQQPSAEALFADFLDRLETGELVDFDAFCRLHAAAEPALRKVHVRWQAMSQAFTHLSLAGPAPTATAPSPSLADLKQRLASPGGRLARYVLRDEIARGGMGRIVSAWDEELRREVALKIHRGDAADHRQQRRFLEEAQIAAQLDHPGIVPVHELGVDDEGRPFFAMQLVRGRDLGQILQAVQAGEDGWSRTRVLSVLLRVCEAMAFAHDKGVVHRDLKPANIMVGRFGETYVMDWGLAHAQGTPLDPGSGGGVATLRQTIADEDGDSALLTRTGDVIGTPAYMAPEQAVDGQSVSPAVDVYSLGAVLYHLLAGAMPYGSNARSADAVLQALRAGPPPPLPHDVPPELRAICERAMARAAAQRYATMLELGDDLRAFLEVRTVRAYATGRFAELRKWVARNRTLAAVLGAFALAVVVGAIAMAALWASAEDARGRAGASAVQLQVELDRSAFQGARQALQLGDSSRAADVLWRAHFAGRMPRATGWALKELAARDPYVAVEPTADDRAIAFAHRGDTVLVGGADGRLQVRDVPTLALAAGIGEGGHRLSAVVALDGTTAVAGTTDGEVLWFDLRARRIVRRARAHQGEVTCLAAQHAGFASGGADGKVCWWPADDGTPQVVLTHDARISGLALRPGGDGVFAGDDAGWISGVAFDRSWTIGKRRHAEAITTVAFDSGRDRLWFGDNHHQVRRLDLLDASKQWMRWTRNGACNQLIGTNDGSLLIGGWWRTDRMAADGSAFAPVALRPVTHMVMSPDQRWLVTTNPVGLGVVDLLPTDQRQIPGIGATALSGDGRLLATSAGNHATIYDVATGKVAFELPKGSNGWLAFDDDGSHLAVTKLQPGTISVHEVATGRVLHTAPGPTGGSGAFARFRPGSDELAFATGPDRLRRVHTVSGETIAEYVLPATRVTALSYSADGSHLAAVADWRTSVRVFELGTGNHRDEEFARDWPANVTPDLNAVALSRDGSKVAAGNGAGPIRVRTADGSTLAIAGHAGTVWSLQFAADDPGLLFSTGGSQGIAAWDLDSGACCYQAVQDQASQLDLSADGHTLACTTPAGAFLLDLSYRDRHVAGNLPVLLDQLRGEVEMPAGREAELRQWATAVQARAWPRWR